MTRSLGGRARSQRTSRRGFGRRGAVSALPEPLLEYCETFTAADGTWTGVTDLTWDLTQVLRATPIIDANEVSVIKESGGGDGTYRLTALAQPETTSDDVYAEWEFVAKGDTPALTSVTVVIAAADGYAVPGDGAIGFRIIGYGGSNFSYDCFDLGSVWAGFYFGTNTVIGGSPLGRWRLEVVGNRIIVTHNDVLLWEQVGSQTAGEDWPVFRYGNRAGFTIISGSNIQPIGHRASTLDDFCYGNSLLTPTTYVEHCETFDKANGALGPDLTWTAYSGGGVGTSDLQVFSNMLGISGQSSAPARAAIEEETPGIRQYVEVTWVSVASTESDDPFDQLILAALTPKGSEADWYNDPVGAVWAEIHWDDATSDLQAALYWYDDGGTFHQFPFSDFQSVGSVSPAGSTFRLVIQDGGGVILRQDGVELLADYDALFETSPPAGRSAGIAAGWAGTAATTARFDSFCLREY